MTKRESSPRKTQRKILPRMDLLRPRSPGRASNKRGLFQIGKVVKEVDNYLRQYKPIWGFDPGNRWSRANDTKRSARNYCIGLLLPGRRKNMTGIARRVNVDNNSIQQLISDSPWDYRSVISTNMKTMARYLATDKGMIIFDDTGQVKQGKLSPGVKRQYSGTLGKTGNCQVIVSDVYAIPGESLNSDAIYWPLNMELYLPEEWFENLDRVKVAGIPEDLSFRTKPEIALEHMKVILEAKIPHCGVLADAGYGTSSNFRKELRGMKERYILGVRIDDISLLPEDTPIIPPGQKKPKGRPTEYPSFPDDVTQKTARVISNEIPHGEWVTVKWAEGTKGELKADFVRRRVRVINNGRPSDEKGWLLIEQTKSDEMKAYICWGFDDSSLEDLVKLAHFRWPVEQCFKQMKGEVGMTDFEGRKWNGFHHHAAMVILAFCFLVLLRVGESNGSDPLPTLPQIRRELLRLYTRRFLELRLKISSEEAESIIDDLPFIIPE